MRVAKYVARKTYHVSLSRSGDLRSSISNFLLRLSQFKLWNNDLSEGFRADWLAEHGAQNVTIPYRYNRAAIFDSKRLHATDKYYFKEGYENRRINLTLLYGGIKNNGGGTEVEKMNNNLYAGGVKSHSA